MKKVKLYKFIINLIETVGFISFIAIILIGIPMVITQVCNSIEQCGYKKGQLDALNGIWKYEKVVEINVKEIKND